MVIRDAEGDVLASMVCKLQHISDAGYLEMMALWREIQLAHELFNTSYVLELDCKAIVREINGGQKNLPILGHLIGSIQELINSSPYLQLKFISRNINGVVIPYTYTYHG